MDVNKELEEIFSDSLLDLSDKEITLFNMPADMKRVMDGRRLQPDHYAQKKECEDFHLYKHLFEQVHQELKEGKRTLIRTSKTANLDEGHFYVVDGMLVYFESIREKTKSSNGLTDGRTRCIYENGTESDILLQTLRTNVLKNGYGVTDTQEQIDSALSTTIKTDSDKATGYVYVLKSLSQNPEIAKVENLYKIGFTINSVEERIAHAENEPTYLMAPVKIVETAEIINMNSHIFETLVHQIFNQVQFQVKVYDNEGVEHIPTEWYVAPLPIIELVIQKIVDGSITKYSYNAQMECLEKCVVRKKSQFKTDGLRVLTLNIKREDFERIMAGEKTEECREIKQTTINKFTYIDPADNKRYLRQYDVLHLYVGFHKKEDSAIVEVTDTSYHDGIVTYHLGRILEHVKQEEH